MSIFSNIDLLLEDFAVQLNARISKDRPNAPENLRTFEERRIDWIDNNINKAIIITPTFEDDGVNSELWHFRAVAWQWKNNWRKSKVVQGFSELNFTSIEANINELLEKAKQDLLAIQENDLTE